MKLCLVLFLCMVVDFGNGGQVQQPNTPSIIIDNFNSYVTDKNHTTDKIFNETEQRYYNKNNGTYRQSFNKKINYTIRGENEKKLTNFTVGILEDARKLFTHSSLNQTITFKLLNTRFLRNGKVLAMDENAPKYLSSYCDWQSKKKLKERTLYFSVLLTGLDLFHVNNGKLVRSNSGRGYTRGMCSARKSCALIEWDPKLTGFLLAHEIGHSLGMRHDGPPYNQCNDQKNIMAVRYSGKHHPTSWSTCSWYSLRQFLRTSKAWCVKNENDRRVAGKNP